MSDVTNEDLKRDSDELDDIKKHYENMEVIGMLQPIVTMMAAQEERLSRKINDVHNDVRRINGSVAKAHTDIAEFKHECVLRGEKCAATLSNVKGANWIIERLSEMSKRPKTAIVIFLIFIIAVQTLVLEAIEHKWLSGVWDYVRLIF